MVLCMKKILHIRAWPQNVRPILAGLAAGLCFIWVQSAFAASPQPLEREAKTCERAIKAQERRAGIPQGLLNAISHAESGRWASEHRATIAWPWTVTTGGKGHFLPNRADAVAFVKSLQADGVKNIDVGCLQINLKYHPDAFVSISHAFDPNANAAYAADFLRQRFAISKSWIKAVGDYHSTTPKLNKAYRDKVAKIWHAAPKKQDTVMAQAKSSVVAFNPSLTQRFNQSFLARKTAGGIRGSGLAIANRIKAQRPGASRDRLKGQAQTTSFAKNRQAQLMAWRQTNGLKPVQSLMPTIPKSITVQ
ncbi:MAG: hypothetical protein COB46_01980 [Rhodospirillaceae bacterium]|nr:MAG: hypothetical protein COB46_01980 [Rhodospirillaceae bacterium]